MTNEIVEFYLSALGDAPTPKAPSART